MGITITVKETGNKSLFMDVISHDFLARSTERIVKEIEENARKDYMDKRKSTKTPSLIFNSFTYSLPFKTKDRVVGVVSVGGPSAPYAIYVDEGHSYSNKTTFSGYHFMDAGWKKTESDVDKIITEEFNKK